MGVEAPLPPEACWTHEPGGEILCATPCCATLPSSTAQTQPDSAEIITSHVCWTCS